MTDDQHDDVDQAAAELRNAHLAVAQLKTASVLHGVALAATFLIGVSDWFRPVAVAALVAALAFACTAPRTR